MKKELILLHPVNIALSIENRFLQKVEDIY